MQGVLWVLLLESVQVTVGGLEIPKAPEGNSASHPVPLSLEFLTNTNTITNTRHNHKHTHVRAKVAVNCRFLAGAVDALVVKVVPPAVCLRADVRRVVSPVRCARVHEHSLQGVGSWTRPGLLKKLAQVHVL